MLVEVIGFEVEAPVDGLAAPAAEVRAVADVIEQDESMLVDIAALVSKQVAGTVYYPVPV